jgi:hypothetical protein
MSLTVPSLDDRRYQQLLDEALARIPVHTPEWTNFNPSDPGVALVEVFAFLTENLLYRANLIPERNRRKFLTLLGLPLYPGSSAQGMVTFTNERGALRTITLNDDLEVRAGQVPFRTEMGLDVLPIEVQPFYKRKVDGSAPEVRAYYSQLYASYLGTPPLNATDVTLYETRPMPTTGVDLSAESIDHSLWLALLMRPGDKPFNDAMKDEVRRAIANRTLSLGMLPQLADDGRRLAPVGQENPESGVLLRYQIPSVPASGELPRALSERVPRYQSLPAMATVDVLAQPGIVQISLPDAGQIALWSNLDPLEAGVGDFPPTLEDTTLNDRLITWLRISAPTSVRARFLWVGANATLVNQRARVANELLPSGSGEPDQVVQLAHTPVIPESLLLTVTLINGTTDRWTLIDDLFAAGAEVPVRDPRLPPGAPMPVPALSTVFTLNAESGELRFGDGTHGARPPFGAVLRASYDYGMGAKGNLGANAISTGPALPAGLKVNSPVPTWGGAESETVQEGEKQITRYLQHRDRLVTSADFEAITYRTPGVEVGRVDVLPAFNPEIGSSEPGDAPGAVTLMLIPKYDPLRPNAPLPDRLFLDAVCAYLDSRRMVTTEVFLRAPRYRSVWVSIGITVAPRVSLAQATEDVKAAVQRFLSPLPPPGLAPLDAQSQLFGTAQPSDTHKGWPLRKSVLRLELIAVANRVQGVQLVNGVLLFDENGNARDEIQMRGLDLPYLAGITVVAGDPLDASQLPGLGSEAGAGAGTGTGTTGGTGGGGASPLAPVPFIPEECR